MLHYMCRRLKGKAGKTYGQRNAEKKQLKPENFLVQKTAWLACRNLIFSFPRTAAPWTAAPWTAASFYSERFSFYTKFQKKADNFENRNKIKSLILQQSLTLKILNFYMLARQSFALGSFLAWAILYFLSCFFNSWPTERAY